VDNNFKEITISEITDLIDYTTITRTNWGCPMFDTTYYYWSGSWNILSSFQCPGDIQW